MVFRSAGLLKEQLASLELTYPKNVLTDLCILHLTSIKKDIVVKNLPFYHLAKTVLTL